MFCILSSKGRTIYNCREDIPGIDESSEEEEEHKDNIYYIYESEGSDDTWKFIGIGLIALFGVFSLICCIIIFRLFGWFDDCICCDKYKEMSSKRLPPVPVLDEEQQEKEDTGPSEEDVHELNTKDIAGGRF